MANFIYIGFIIIGFFFNIYRGFFFRKNDIVIYYFLLFFITYTLLKVLLFPEEIILILKGLGIFLIIPFYWVSLFRCKSMFDFEKFLASTIPYVVVVSFFALVQYYISPDLFGLLSKSTSNSIQWASDKDTEVNYKLFLRTTSFLSSPQVFGLFTILYVFIIDDFLLNSKYKTLLLTLIVIIGSIHSGNKMTFLILAIYLSYKYYKSKSKAMFSLVFILFGSVFLFFLLFFINIEDVRFLFRVFQNENLLNEETEGRLKIYSELLASGNWFLGKFPGYISGTFDSDGFMKVTESYFLLILLENGLFILFGYFVLFIYNIFQTRFLAFKSFPILNISIFLSMFFVHAHTDPVFFILFGVILYGPFYISSVCKKTI